MFNADKGTKANNQSPPPPPPPHQSNQKSSRFQSSPSPGDRVAPLAADDNDEVATGEANSAGRGSLGGSSARLFSSASLKAGSGSGDRLLADQSSKASEEGDAFISGKKSKKSKTQKLASPFDQRISASARSKQKALATLAKQESLNDNQDDADADNCCSMRLARCMRSKKIWIPLLLVLVLASLIYCVPYVEIDPKTTRRLPDIPFNYRDGPLRASSASSFKIERLFLNQISGPESIAIDSSGNMYLAIEGGFVLYAHMNQSSPPRRSYYDNSPKMSPLLSSSTPGQDSTTMDYIIEEGDLIKIAELNPIKQMPFDYRAASASGRRARADSTADHQNVAWRRECQLDEKVYGPALHQGGSVVDNSPGAGSSNELEPSVKKVKKFVSNVAISRCSKPLGLRLSPDESTLYVVDTLAGLYKINLRVADKPHSTQRLVTKLIDFKAHKSQLLPVYHFADQPSPSMVANPSPLSSLERQATDSGISFVRARQYLNVSLMAIDDLTIDYGAGTNGGDVIYLSDASQNWHAISFVFDMLEGRPSGMIIRFDTGSNQISVLNPNLVAQVRTSSIDFDSIMQQPARYAALDSLGSSSPGAIGSMLDAGSNSIFMGIGAPRLDENDVFDDRPLHFPNGLQLTDDRQAILIADTTNKRIIKHYIRGHRRGTSDLWAWTPNFPDNIRRGYDKRHETYWVAGCGQDPTNKIDFNAWLHSWPMVRKFILKNIYLAGMCIEALGSHVIGSVGVRDFGYSLKIGATTCESFCPGMMILQYNSHGDIIRSIYGREFPRDVAYYSQVTEYIDPKHQEHILYMGSPSYKYVTKLVLPTDSYDLPQSAK